jgi:hypothetical protein
MGYIVGNDGGVNFGGDYFMSFNAWSLNLTKTSTDITAFGDAGKRRRLGVIDMTGSAGGHMKYNASSTDPGLADFVSATSVDGVASCVFTVIAGCTITATVVVSQIALSSDKNGDATASFNFELSGGAAPSVAWDETA